MKRVTEKVRDIVEVRPFTHLHDFSADPALTLGSYHFTDITADLMAKWIDKIAEVKSGRGTALALAGFRGVGKSHFLAVVAAIVARPELRGRIADQHAASSADRLSRRHYPLAFVRRGTSDSLLDELKRSIAEILGVNPGSLSDSLYDLLLKASDHAGELPLVILIDTALGRESRVARDDGMLLSELAEAAKTLGIFVGVALDDDISGADGANSSIAGSFNIDYLDQEHLYKIVDTHIFSKHPKMLGVLNEIYHSYRAVLPGFRWSEQRFSSLYPLHPATLEIAPLIRLYVHDFALLGFASEAGVKILGRPADSLIGLDEVFANVEAKLRLVPELTEAFAAFDALERDVVAKTPVQVRLPSKLILKGLFLLSLNGQGSTAAETAAAMMIFDENGSGGFDIAKLLDSFAEALPEAVLRATHDNGEPKYLFKLTAADEVSDSVAAAAKDISDEAIWDILIRQTVEKFSDVDLSDELGTHPTICSVEWRGALRRGEIVWMAADETDTVRDRSDMLDWTVHVENSAAVSTGESQGIIWKVAALATDEKEMLARHHLLQSNTELREQFGPGLNTAMHVASIAVDKIWQRVFLNDGRLVTADGEHAFTEEVHAAHSVSQLFTGALAPLFASVFPSHPEFSQPLGMKQVSALIANFFSSGGTNNSDTQKLAESFALPLGLAVRQGDALVPAPPEVLSALDTVSRAFRGVDDDPKTTVALADISARLREMPDGLTRESHHLIMAALVAQRQYDFVTSSGNRINHRSLDLQIVWDDVVGLARPLTEQYSAGRLLVWAKLISGHTGISSLDRPEDRSIVIDSLSGWLTGWRAGRFLDQFDALPDENLNAAIWRTAGNLRKTFGAMADITEQLVNDELPLDQCLQYVADLFSDSEAEFEAKKKDLFLLREFTAGVLRRDEIIRYVSICEPTFNAELEMARRRLLDMIAADHLTVGGSQQIEPFWEEFKELYSAHYQEKHDAVMNQEVPGHALNEILRSDLWTAFDGLCSIPAFEAAYGAKAKQMIREMRQSYCDLGAGEVLVSRPYCGCGLSLAEIARLGKLPSELRKLVSDGLASFRATLIKSDDTTGVPVSKIIAGLGESDEYSHMSESAIKMLQLAAAQAFDLPAATGPAAVTDDETFGDFLPDELHAWEHEVDRTEVFVDS